MQVRVKSDLCLWTFFYQSLVFFSFCSGAGNIFQWAAILVFFSWYIFVSSRRFLSVGRSADNSKGSRADQKPDRSEFKQKWDLKVMKTHETKPVEAQLKTSWAETNGSSVLSSQRELALIWQTNLIDFSLFLMGVQWQGQRICWSWIGTKGASPCFHWNCWLRTMLNTVIVWRSSHEFLGLKSHLKTFLFVLALVRWTSS